MNLKTEATHLKSMLIELDVEHPYGETLFQDRYQILYLKNFLTWYKPLGERFRHVAAVCEAKKIPTSSVVSVGSNIIKSTDESTSFTEDFIGCPLECVFDTSTGDVEKIVKSNDRLNAVKREYNLYPINFRTSSKILQIYSAIVWNDNSNPIPLVVFSYQGNNSKSMFILGTLIDNNKNIRLQLTSKGSFTKLKDLPSIISLQESHVIGGLNPSITEISASAHYDILGEPIEDKPESSLKPCKNLKMSLDCSWADVRSILESPASDCSCVVKIQTIAGDEESGASARYKELMLVEALYNYLQNSELTWPSVISDQLFLKNVSDFMNAKRNLTSNPRMTEHAPPVKAASDDSTDCHTAFEVAITEPRGNMDFTNDLWVIFKECPSLESLKKGLQLVFIDLEDFSFPPFIARSNDSTIGRLVKDVDTNRKTLELDDSKAIKLLLEIGVEKLRKDYIMLFVGLELVPYQSISFGLQPDLVSEEALVCLKKFHVVLELVIAIQKCLKLSNRYLCAFVRNTLQYYASGNDIDLLHVFSFGISSICARPLLNAMVPTKWEISFLNNEPSYLKQTCYKFSAGATHEHMYASKELNSKYLVDTTRYACTMGVMLEDNVFGKK